MYITYHLRILLRCNSVVMVWPANLSTATTHLWSLSEELYWAVLLNRKIWLVPSSQAPLTRCFSNLGIVSLTFWYPVYNDIIQFWLLFKTCHSSLSAVFRLGFMRSLVSSTTSEVILDLLMLHFTQAFVFAFNSLYRQFPEPSKLCVLLDFCGVLYWFFLFELSSI